MDLPDDPADFEAAVQRAAAEYRQIREAEARLRPFLRAAVLRRHNEGERDRAELARWSGLTRQTVVSVLRDAGVEVGEEPEGPRRARERRRKSG